MCMKILFCILFLFLQYTFAIEVTYGNIPKIEQDIVDISDGEIVNYLESLSSMDNILKIIILMTILSVAPSILIMATAFTRIIIVLSILRNAIAIPQSPPNMVLTGLALFLTFFIMEGTFIRMQNEAILPLLENEISELEALSRAKNTLYDFIVPNTRESDIELFGSFKEEKIDFEKIYEIPMSIILPAFMISEIRRAFEIGFLIFLPFLIIDIVVSSILMAMGMMMLPPVTISLPFKILFFVLIDGWYLISKNLVESFVS